MAETPPSTANGSQPSDPRDAAYLALHAERESLERALVLAQQQQRFAGEAAAAEQARQRESALLRELDRVLTQIRAAEVRRKPGTRRW